MTKLVNTEMTPEQAADLMREFSDSGHYLKGILAETMREAFVESNSYNRVSCTIRRLDGRRGGLYEMDVLIDELISRIRGTFWVRIDATDTAGMEREVQEAIRECELNMDPVTVGNVSFVLREKRHNVPASINQIEAWIEKYATRS